MKKQSILWIGLLVSSPVFTNNTPKADTDQQQTTAKTDTKEKHTSYFENHSTVDLSKFTQDPNNEYVKYKIIKKGKGLKPIAGETVTAHYVGHVLNGNQITPEEFDSSRTRGKTFSFKLGAGQVIKSWDISLAAMKPGEVRLIIAQPEAAYGSNAMGKIPANATLMFEIELISAE